MEDEFESFEGQDADQTSDELKKKVAENASDAAVQTQDDPSRSSLHYGDEHDPDVRSGPTDEADSHATGVDLSENANAGSDPGSAPATGQSVSHASSAGTGSAAFGAIPLPEVPQNQTSPDADENTATNARSDHAKPQENNGLDQGNAATTPPADARSASKQPEEILFQVDDKPQNSSPTDVSLSNSAVAENAEGAVVGQLDVVDADKGDTHSFKLSDDRFEVVNGTVKLKDGVALDRDEDASVSFDITATDEAGAEFTQSFTIDVAEMPDVAVGTGFHASYFDVDHSLRSIDQVDWDSEPTHQEMVDDINYKNSADSFWEGGSRDTFGAKITGNIEVEEAGTFNFHIGGDDGVVLFIDGIEVVDNDGLHGFRTRSGEVELDPGPHVIEVRYFENYGHAGLKVEWEGPGIDGRQLLTGPDVEDMQTVSGMPVTVALDIDQSDVMDGAINHLLEGLPEGTIVTAGAQTSEIDETGSVDVTDWDTSLLSITPPSDFTGSVDATLTTIRVLEDGQTVSAGTDIGFIVEPAQLEASGIEMQTGFHAEYYDVDHSIRKLDDLNWDAEPTHEEIVSEINYKNGSGSFWKDGSTDTFGAKITGNVTIEEGGSYDFYVGGDDGVSLFINGKEVIDNDGLHGYRTRSGEIELEPGTHEIEVRYFENYGHAGLKLEWNGPDTDGRELVQADPDLSVAQNGTLQVSLDAGHSTAVTVSGLPADTILVSGDNHAVSDGTEMDLSGWNLDYLEIMPPSEFVGEITATFNAPEKAFNGQIVENQHEFTISVGDIDSIQGPDHANDEMLMASHQTEGASRDGWSDTGENDVSAQDGEGDDTMSENVETTQGSEQSFESFETHDQQSW